MPMSFGWMVMEMLNCAVALTLQAYAILKTEFQMNSIPGSAF